MKRHLLPTLLVALLALTGVASAQQAALDEIDKKAAQLESDLGKQLDTTARAADIMIELVNLYHQHGRVFGLVRAGQKFITAHPTHKAHRDVMLKLLDGQTVLSRNKEIVATARQFVQRYPTDAACVQVEKLLARTLDQQNDRKIAAAAHEAVYRRNPAAEREAGAVAIYLYTNLNNAEGFKSAAAIGKHMLENLPAGEFTAQAGWDALNLLRRIGDWGGANGIAQAMLKRGVPMDKSRLSDLHAIISENYIQAGQRANAIEHLKLARAAVDSPDLFARQIYWSYESNAKGGELEAMANDFATRYPARAERWQNLALAAHAHARENNRAKAVEIFMQVVPNDPWAHDAATHYVRYLNDKPEDYAKAEAFLREAAGKSAKGAPAILHAMAFDLFRDRMKDAAKTRAAARELATKFPMDDSRSWNAAAHILSNPENPQQFIADVKALAEQALSHGNLASYRDHVPRWIKEAAKTKEHKENARIAKEVWDKYAANPVLKDWETATSERGQLTLAARERLVAGEALKQRTDEQARWLLMALGQHYYYNMPQQRKAEAIPFFARLSARLPQDVEAAGWWLTAASDYGSPEQAREAALREPGTVAVGIGETADLGGGLRVRPLEVVEDSRCPQDARCVWAGRLRVRVAVENVGDIEVTDDSAVVMTPAGGFALVAVLPGPWTNWPQVQRPQYRFGFRRD